jgi:molybdopterin/thiamine biosynthesis adenylyltransferase
MSNLVLVVGVGALGSHVVQFMRNVDANIRVCDFDRVDAKNTQSQFHSKSNLGKSKVLSLSQTMQFLFGTRIETIPHRLVQVNALELLRPAGLVIDCLDNFESRTVLQLAVRSLARPCLHGALAADGGFGRVVWDETFLIDQEDSQGAATCEGGEHLPFICMVSSYLAQAAKMFLEKGRRVGFHIHPTGAISI